ncbi:MAG TPA: endo-1,4-beta-xylanase, partial [Phycisphaerae bacterium]|nr:endo-1,4-beta-xylanase [Phycisphaerae bacterium]
MPHRRRPALLLALLAFLLPACAASPAAWKNLADRNIDRYRKRDAQLQLLSPSGQPLANIPLRITQTRQAFPFGAAISRSFLQNPRWQQEFLRHFNYAVFENEAKWYSNEPAPGRITYRDADALLAWCDAHHIPVRGHNLFWEVARWQQPWLAALDHDALAAAVQKRLDDALSHFRGRFTSWDVDNEALHGDFFTSRLGPGVIPWMFQAAHQRD